MICLDASEMEMYLHMVSCIQAYATMNSTIRFRKARAAPNSSVLVHKALVLYFIDMPE